MMTIDEKRQILQALIKISKDRPDILIEPQKFSAAIKDVLAEPKHKGIANLIIIAVKHLNAYNKLSDAAASKNIFVFDNLVMEFIENFHIQGQMANDIISLLAILAKERSIDSFLDIENELENEPEPKIAGAIKIGSQVNFGSYMWQVIDIKKNKALIITTNVIDELPYNSTYRTITWEKTSLRKYLNNTFYNNFNEEEKNRIIITKNINTQNPWFKSDGGNTTFDRIFLLNLEEIVKYFGDSGQLKYKNSDNKWRIDDIYNEKRIATTASGDHAWWWLRSPGLTNKEAAYVLGDGNICVDGYYVFIKEAGIRPALWINVESKIFSNKLLNASHKLLWGN